LITLLLALQRVNDVEDGCHSTQNQSSQAKGQSRKIKTRRILSMGERKLFSSNKQAASP
jgi:hypothetical protein